MFTGRRLGRMSVMSWPSSRTRPASGRSNPAMTRSRVVLPQPDGPSSAKNSFSAIASDRLSTAVTPPKRFVTPSAATTIRCSPLIAAHPG